MQVQGWCKTRGGSRCWAQESSCLEQSVELSRAQHSTADCLLLLGREEVCIYICGGTLHACRSRVQGLGCGLWGGDTMRSKAHDAGARWGKKRGGWVAGDEMIKCLESAGARLPHGAPLRGGPCLQRQRAAIPCMLPRLPWHTEQTPTTHYSGSAAGHILAPPRSQQTLLAQPHAGHNRARSQAEQPRDSTASPPTQVRSAPVRAAPAGPGQRPRTWFVPGAPPARTGAGALLPPPPAPSTWQTQDGMYQQNARPLHALGEGVMATRWW